MKPHLKQYLKQLQIMKVLNKKPTSQLTFPSGGDQLTRVRFTYGRKLRAGAHTSKDRLEHSQPDVIELFHTKQAFLAVSTAVQHM